MSICDGCFMSKECELYDYNIESDCPCRECLVKIICRDVCQPWVKYLTSKLYDIYSKRYGDYEATISHVNNKVKRLKLLRHIRGTVGINPCVFK
jgi:hypothetical protein